MLDSREPLPFTDVAVTLLAPGARSPSSDLTLRGPGQVVIEYALWVDMEIGHAGELEHVWVFADESGKALAVQGSAHGVGRTMATPELGSRPVVYSEPGKHGMAASPADYAISRALINTLCGVGAGTMGVLTPRDGNKLGCSVAEYRQAWNRLRQLRFTPAWDAGLRLDTRDLSWWTWEQLDSQRRPRALAAVADAPSSPVQVSVGVWGGQEEAWIGRSTFDGAELLLADMPASEAFAQAQRHERLVLAVAETADMVSAVAERAWDCYASAHTFIVCTSAAEIERPAALAVPAEDAVGTTQLIVADTARDDFLTLGPGGDLDCSIELLQQHGWTVRTGR